MSANNKVFEHIINTFEMEMDNEIFKQNNDDQVKDNPTKLEYTNYGKNINDSPSFIKVIIYRSSHQRCSVRKGVLRNFTKFT